MFGPTWLHFLGLYAAVMLWLRHSNQREFLEHPEKGARYEKLPLPYKLACWFGVAPLPAAVVFHEGFGGLAVLCYFLLDTACRRWYRKAGLF